MSFARAQLTIREKHGPGGKLIREGEIWGILYFDAKTTPGWDDKAHPPVWLQPIATMAARIAFQGRKSIMASDNDQIPSAIGNMTMLTDRHTKPVAEYDQIKGEQALFLVGEPSNGCNFGLYLVPKTSDEARLQGGSNTLFDDISLENADQVLMQAAERVTTHAPGPWGPAHDLFRLAAQEEWKAWHSLALSYIVESTNDIIMMILALAVTTIANFYPANDPCKRESRPRDIAEDIWCDMKQHCGWAQIGSEQTSMGLIRAATTEKARVITLPGSTMMTNKVPRMFRTQIDGKGYNVPCTMMPPFFHAYGSAKERLLHFTNRVLKPIYAESLRGGDTYTNAYKISLIPSQVDKSQGVDTCYRIRHAKDQELEAISSMITCQKCMCPNFDLITLIEQEHIMCPRCQTPAEITHDLVSILTDAEKVTNQIVPTLIRNGIIPNGLWVTTWRLPIAPDVEAISLPATHFDNQMTVWRQTAPMMAAAMEEKKGSIVQNARSDPVGITRNLTMVQLPRPVRVTDLKPWDKEQLQNVGYMKTLHKDGMSASQLEKILIPPYHSKHIQCIRFAILGS